MRLTPWTAGSISHTGAAHALCLAALRHHGFRPSKRYIVFQVLPDTLGLGSEVWRVLSKCHDMRNRTEYEGALDVDERLVTDLIRACRKWPRRSVSFQRFSRSRNRMSGCVPSSAKERRGVTASRRQTQTSSGSARPRDDAW
jgi:hypothetical protein